MELGVHVPQEEMCINHFVVVKAEDETGHEERPFWIARFGCLSKCCRYQPYTALRTLFVVVALIAAELLPIVSSATIAASSSFFQGCASNFFLINAVES